MTHPRFACLCLALVLSAAAADTPAPVQTTPKLEILNRQITENAEDAQAYANRGYVLALLGRKDEARGPVRWPPCSTSATFCARAYAMPIYVYALR